MLVVGGLAISTASAKIWYEKIYTSPKNVFYGMVENNLTVQGMTRVITNKQQGDSIIQTTNYNFIKSPSVATHTMIDQQGDHVETETRGFMNGSFARYVAFKPDTSIVGRTTPDLSAILGRWANAGSGQQADGTKDDQYLRDALYSSSLLPFGNLTTVQRRDMMKYLIDNKVFDPKLATAKKDTVEGRKVYRYQVGVDSAAQMRMLKKYSDILKISDQSLVDDPSSPGGTLSVEMIVDIDSRQLVELHAGGSASGYSQKFIEYGVAKVSSKPTTNLTVKDLQDAISKTSGSQPASGGQ